MQTNNTIGNSLIETITSSGIPDITTDLSEIAIDAMLKDGLLKEVPVVSSLLGIAKTVTAFRDYFLLRKLIAFLNGIKDADPEDREKFAQEIENNPKQRQEIGGKLIVYIDRLDDLNKAEMLARLFKSRLKREISMNEFFSFTAIVDRIYIQDLQRLVNDLSTTPVSPHNLRLHAEYFYPFGLSIISFDQDVLNKHLDDLSNPNKHFSGSFDNFITFYLTAEAFKLAQILAEKKISMTEYIQQNRFRRK